MRILPIIIFLFCSISLVSCDKKENDDDSMPEQTTHLLKITNNSGLSECFGEFLDDNTITFLISYRDVQASADITNGAGGTGFFNVLVEDAESINVKVFKTDDDTLLADTDINVRTSSRPGPAEVERQVIFCNSFDLIVLNF